jgi:hypothetical protein
MKNFAVLIAALLLAVMSHAQATRTWVSGVGDDANPCSRTAPCKTFAGAISKTAVAGEIDALDPGGFGAVTITKAITIDGAAAGIAGVLVSGTNGIVVSAGATDVVILRNLDIEGLGTGLNGISFVAGGVLIVEKCTIDDFTEHGINFDPSGAAQLVVEDTDSRHNAVGIWMEHGTSSSLNRVRLEDNSIGVEAAGNTTIRDSAAAANNWGFYVPTGGILNIENSMAVNGARGLYANGGVARISNTTIINNSIGISIAAGGQILSYGDNEVTGNGSSQAPTGSIAKQ